MFRNVNRTCALAVLVPVIAIGATNSAMGDEMPAPEMRVWSTALGSPDENGMRTMLQIVASKSTMGSNSLVIEKVGLVTTKTTKGDDGVMMTETVSSTECAGPFMLDGHAFAVAGPDAERAEGDPEPCTFSVSGKAHDTYRPWKSWDFKGTVTAGEQSVGFMIESPKPAMLVEQETEESES